MSKVYFYEVFEEEQKALIKFLPFDIEAKFCSCTAQQSPNTPEPKSIISIRTQSQIPEQWLKNISGIHTRSQGYDHLVKLLKDAKSEVPCGYLDAYCSASVAEQAVLTMLSLMRRWKKQLSQLEYFNRNGLTGEEAYHKNALIVGTGHIGCEIIRITRGIGMQVKGVDPLKNCPEIEYTMLEDGISWADVIFCAADLNNSSTGLLDYKKLKNNAKGFYLVNVSRGEITPFNDLKRLLDEGRMKGLGLDVYQDEQAVGDSLREGSVKWDSYAQDVLALKNRDNVVFTPHNAFNTQEALERKAQLSIEAIQHFIKTRKFSHPVRR